ncbi:MAG TPA: hypothetical protein VH682_28100 [Gemmataceae bacterium]
MRYIRFFIATVGIAAALFMGVRLETEPVAAKGGNPCKQPKPVCERGLVAVCTRHNYICGCMKWTCGPLMMKPPNAVTKPPMTKPPLKPTKPLPGSRLN